MEFDIPAPPVIDKPESPQLAMMLIPALTSASMLMYGIISHQFFLLVLGILVTVASMATPRLMHTAAKKSAQRRNGLREQRYGELLNSFAVQIQSATDAVRVGLESVHPTPDQLPQWIHAGRLWERRVSDPDFLDVAVGVADIPSGITVSVGKSASLEAEVFADLQDRAVALERSAGILENAPLVASLKDCAVLSVEGTREHAVSLVRAMLLEAIVCCGPDELSLLVATPPECAREWEWAALIPHALHRNDASRSIPAIATSWKDLAIALARTAGARIQLLAADDQALAKAGLQHVIIVLDNYHPLSELMETPLIKETFARAAELAITVLTINYAAGNSPAEAACVVTAGSNGIATMRSTQIPSPSVRFGPLSAPGALASAVTRQISDMKLVTDISYGADSSQDLLLDLLNRRPLGTEPPSWQRLPGRDFLTATFGVQADGRPFRLDLKEGAVQGDGPHGLLVGATGSGKSELLRSMVTSLAMTHDPAWLQMAFVDFKGGAAFDSLAELPHCAGYITNILEDLSLIERMRSSLQGELLARQRQFAATGLDLQNIRDYWLLRETQPELPPMPYLLLVIDEFGELLEVSPEFLDVLLAIGRQGRSLGVHLILSSQRLEAGRIRGLESYLSYRIALRTFTADESAAVIGSKLAASLPPLAGHGYFRAAETFQRFKASQVSVDGDLRKSPHSPDSAEPGDGGTDLTRVVKWMSGVRRVPPLWLRPLPNTANGEILAMDDERLAILATPRPVREGLPVAVGLLDDPQNRRQVPAIFDAGRGGGHVAVVGAPQSGKSSAMVTEVLQAARTYPPALLRFFLLDFGGGLLTAIRDLPNVGACATPQEPDRVARIITEMVTLLDERAIEFRRSSISSMADLRSRVERDIRGNLQAHTVLIIDNYAAFKERYMDLDPAVERILVEGANFGLHVQLTSSRWGNVSARKLDQIANRIELRLNDPTDSAFGKARASAIRTSGPGRALGSSGMQLQFGMPALVQHGQYGPQAGAASPGAENLTAVAVAVSEQARAAWGDLRTPALLLLDDLTTAEFEDVVAETPPGQALLGVNESSFRPSLFEPGRSGNLLIFGDLGTGRTATLARIVSALSGPGTPVAASAVVRSGRSADVHIVDFRGDLVALLGPEAKAAEIASSPDETKKMVTGLDAKLKARMAADAGDEHRPILLVVDDFELVQAMTPTGQSLLGEISPYLLLAERLGFSVMVNQLAAGSQSRGMDIFMRRVAESAPWAMVFSAASRAETLLGGHRGRKLPPARAEIIRTGHPTALISTLTPR